MSKFSDPTSITERLFYAVRALQGEIRPNMRKAAIDYNEQSNTVLLYFYYDKPLNQEENQYDIPGTIIDKMKVFFPKEVSWQGKIIILPYPNRLSDRGNCIYRRYEKPPAED